MDWNFKPSSLDLSDLDHQALPNLDAIGGSTSFVLDAQTGHGFSFDLKLGSVGNDGISGSPSTKLSSPTGSLKRSRGGGNGSQMVSCLVDGCNSDLRTCREYHRRHKVCEAHSKTPEVTINGQKQRFCQQCSRFHSLEEFDEGKRSCRKRLDGHNRRRRKPQPDPLLRPASILSSFQGTKLMPFPGSHVFPTTTVVGPSWSPNVAAANSGLFPVTSPSSSGTTFKLPFLQNETDQRNSRPYSLTKTKGDRTNMFSVRDSDCALSLLSTPQTQTPCTGSSHRVLLQPGGSVPVVHHPLESDLMKQSYAPPHSELVANGRDGGGVYFSEIFQNTEDSHVQGPPNSQPYTLPFHWD